MPLALEPVRTETSADDPTGRIHRAAALVAPPLPDAEPEPPPETEIEEAKWGPLDAVKHPRWPKDTPGGLGGEFMEVGQRFIYGGKEWEIWHIFKDGRVAANEASGNAASAEEKLIDPKSTPGPDNEIGGIKRAPARAIKGGKGELEHGPTDVTVVEPYADPSTHDATIPVPENSDLEPEEWQQFGRLEQLHYTDLQERFGKHTNSGAPNLIKDAYGQYDTEIQDMVSSGYSGQYGASTGFTLSLTAIFKGVFKDKKKLDAVRRKREKAMELQSRIRDAYAWDLYNRTRAPDVVMAHKDSRGAGWWKKNILSGNSPTFSGLSQTHHYRPTWWGSTTGILGAVSIRHVVMATWVAGPMKGASKHYTSEKEFAVPFQLKIDPERHMSFDASDLPSGALKWLDGMTENPAGGEVFRKFMDHIKHGGHLPIPPPPANINMNGGKDYIEPPQGAASALAEYSDDLPAVLSKDYTPEELKAHDLPWEHVDEKGNPVGKGATEAGFGEGDFAMGMKGTLYWLGPNPSDTTGTGLRMHKLVPDGSGGLKFNDETFEYQATGHLNYKLKGNFKPPKVEGEAVFDADAWVYTSGEPAPIAQLQTGDKFKVNNTPYEITGAPGVGQVAIKDLESGLTGKINGDYQTLKLEPKEGYVPEGAKVNPEKGMTFSYEGKKHTITTVSKTGVVSAKPPGGKVIKLDPEDDALEGLFDPKIHQIGKPQPAGNLDVGSFYHGGRGTKTIRPYRIDKKDGSWVYYTNLDSGKTGKMLLKKKVRPLEVEGDKNAADTDTDITKPPDKDYDALKPGDNATVGMLKVGDGFTVGGKTYIKLKPDPYADYGEEKYQVAVVEDGKYVEYDSVGGEQTVHAGPKGLQQTLEAQAEANAKESASDADLPWGKPSYHGYPEGTEIEMQKANGKTWKGKVVGQTTTPKGADALEVTAGKSGKIYSIKLDKVITGPPEAEDTPSAPEPDTPETPDDTTPTDATPADIALDTLPSVSVNGYKSAYGTGGKYKHDKISEMTAGTIFQDKDKKLWKVQVAGAKPIITDGAENYTADGQQRGRARHDVTPTDLPGYDTYIGMPAAPGNTAASTGGFVSAGEVENTLLPSDAQKAHFADLAVGDTVTVQAESGDEHIATVTDNQIAGAGIEVQVEGDLVGMIIYANEVVPPATDTPDPTAWAAGDFQKVLVTNVDGATLDTLPVGSLFTGASGNVYAKSAEDKVTDQQTSMPSDLAAWGLHYKPDQIAFPPREPPPQADGGTLGTTKKGEKVTTGNDVEVEIVAHVASGTVMKGPDGKLEVLPDDWTPEQVTYTVDEQAMEAVQTIDTLEAGDEFENADGHPFMVVTKISNSDTVVVDTVSDEMITTSEGTPLSDVKAKGKPSSPDEFADTPGTEESIEVGAVTAKQILDDLKSTASVPLADTAWMTMDVSGYKSKWGSGGKYKHDRIDELSTGAKFRDKAKNEYIYLTTLKDGLHLVWSPAHGEAIQIGGAIRVRKIG